MREPPVDLTSEVLRTSLSSDYGLVASEIIYLPLGNDSSAWAYRVRASDGALYFLKALKRAFMETSLLVPSWLHEQGIAHVIAPLSTIAGALMTKMDEYALVLYPFIEGKSGKAQGMTPAQWVIFGTMLREIHAAVLAPDLVQRMPRESFAPAGSDVVRELDAHIVRRTFSDPAARSLAQFWCERREQIHMLVERAEELGAHLAQSALPFVLCHADIHTANLLVGSDGQLWIVDWDETLLAPRERDLMFVTGGGLDKQMVGPRDEEMFFDGYGTTMLDPLALTYYCHVRAIEDISVNGTDVFFRTDVSQDFREDAADDCMRLFEPGNIVVRAVSSSST